MISGKSIGSIAHRFVEVGKLRPKIRSLKRENYCKRHLHKSISGEIAYLKLIEEYCDFVRCTYSEESAELVNNVEVFIDQLNQLKHDIDKVISGKKSRVSGYRIREFGRSATALRKQLRRAEQVKDCRDSWIKFGLVYLYLFDH